tara:strand:+ start:778 stop:1812 length:1035 start_codon:yes stop_codon:yes gene_type:complete
MLLFLWDDEDVVKTDDQVIVNTLSLMEAISDVAPGALSNTPIAEMTLKTLIDGNLLVHNAVNYNITLHTANEYKVFGKVTKPEINSYYCDRIRKLKTKNVRVIGCGDGVLSWNVIALEPPKPTDQVARVLSLMKATTDVSLEAIEYNKLALEQLTLGYLIEHQFLNISSLDYMVEFEKTGKGVLFASITDPNIGASFCERMYDFNPSTAHGVHGVSCEDGTVTWGITGVATSKHPTTDDVMTRLSLMQAISDVVPLAINKNEVAFNDISIESLIAADLIIKSVSDMPVTLTKVSDKKFTGTIKDININQKYCEVFSNLKPDRLLEVTCNDTIITWAPIILTVAG